MAYTFLRACPRSEDCIRGLPIRLKFSPAGGRYPWLTHSFEIVAGLRMIKPTWLTRYFEIIILGLRSASIHSWEIVHGLRIAYTISPFLFPNSYSWEIVHGLSEDCIRGFPIPERFSMVWGLHMWLTHSFEIFPGLKKVFMASFLLDFLRSEGGIHGLPIYLRFSPVRG